MTTVHHQGRGRETADGKPKGPLIVSGTPLTVNGTVVGFGTEHSEASLDEGSVRWPKRGEGRSIRPVERRRFGRDRSSPGRGSDLD